MNRPIVIGYHLIWTAYGWWLPNDPRGSGSTDVCTDVLAQLGELHFGRKLAQPAGREVREFYEKAAKLLKHELLKFDDSARQEVGEAFGRVIQEQRYTCYGCVVMPDHVHLLIRKHKHRAEQMIENLKEGARLRLCTANLRSADHPCWCGGGWKVFLDHPDEIRRTIAYIERNPLPLGLPKQSWAFVKPYDGWPLHPGHSPHSPYVQGLAKPQAGDRGGLK
jgi:REP element-mobilizing transposase RayT